METINDEFIEKFKTIKWEQLLEITKSELVIEISNLIKNIKNFGKIFLLFNLNDKDLDKTTMNSIKDRFIELYETYNEKECKNIIEICSQLIYFLNIKNCDLKPFFKDYFYNMFYNIAEEVFCNILSKYKYDSLNDELKNIIYEFYNNPKNQILKKSIFLANEIENNEKFHKEELNNYYINYEDFFDLKQNEKFNFLEKIISKNLLDKKCLEDYLKNIKTPIEDIFNKIKNGSVEYKKIKNFYNNNNDKKEFKIRIELLLKLLNKYEENKNLYNEIEQKIKDINKIKEDLNLMEKKMNKYFKKPKKEDIKEIQDLIIELESYNLDYYLMNQAQIKKFLEQKDIQLLPLNFEKSNFFFKIIYDETKKKIEDEIEIINVTKKKLKNLDDTLNSNSLNNEYINNINKIMNELNEEQYKNLSEEIENLMEFNKDGSKKEKKINTLKIIWKKDLLCNFSIIFKLILTTKENKKTEFTSVNNLICKYLESPKNINIIKVCLDFYKNYEIELNEDKNFEFFRAIKLIKNMNEIAFLLFNVTAKEIQNKLTEYDDNALYDDFNYIKGVLEKFIRFKIFIDSISSNDIKNPKDIDIIRTFVDALNGSEEIRNDFISIIYDYHLIKDEFKIINL